MKTLIKILAAVTFALTCHTANAHNGGGGGGGHGGFGGGGRGGFGGFGHGGFGHQGFGRGYYYGYPGGYFGYGYYPWGWYGYGSDYGYSDYPDSSNFHSRHSLVIDVQGELARRGFYSGAVDGILGPGTHDAIRRFQSKHRLSVTGMIDQKLIQSLGIE